MKNLNQIKNYRKINVKFLAPTNLKGARICIYENKRYNDHKTEKKVFEYCYEMGDLFNQAAEKLLTNGFKIIGSCSDINNYTFLCDNWGQDFVSVNSIK